MSLERGLGRDLGREGPMVLGENSILKRKKKNFDP